MNMDKIINCVLALSFVFMGSCQKAEQSDLPGKTKMPEPEFMTSDPNLSSDDAVKVATQFYSGKIATRSDAGITVKNVVTITDESGEPAIYAVNLQDGYVLVSATKAYYPILAQVDHGTYVLNAEKTGQDVVIQEMVENIKAARDSVCNLSCRPFWLPYEERHAPERTSTRVRTRASDDFESMQLEWYDKWYRDGCRIYYLRRQPEDLPDDVYQRFCTNAAELDPWMDTDYNCMNDVAVITEKFCESVSMKGPFVDANWGQKAPYNSAVNGDRPLGCVTIAVGQLMRYYKRPAYFGWDDMPCRGGSSTTLSAFLAQLRTELHVDNNGSSNIDEAKTVLSYYGYNCTKAAHSAEAVYASLQKNMPVYTRGEDKDGNGHAWVIDGSRSSTAYTEYKLYVLNDCAYPRFEYIELDSWRNYHLNSLVTFHMNWGWCGGGNGWFLDQRIVVDTDKGPVDYYRQRKDLIIK